MSSCRERQHDTSCRAQHSRTARVAKLGCCDEGLLHRIVARVCADGQRWETGHNVCFRTYLGRHFERR